MGVFRRTATGLMVVAGAAGCTPHLQPGVFTLPPTQAVTADGTIVTALDELPRAPVDNYRLVTGDVLEISFPYNREHSVATLVRLDGKITPPLLPAIAAVGRTPEDIRDELRQRYAEMAERLPPPVRRRYLLRTNDVIEVKFPYNEDFTDVVTVRPDGRISLALVGAVIAEGKTPEALETELRRAYANFMAAPELVVIVRAFTSTEFVVDGRRMREPVRDLDDVVVSVQTATPPQIFVAGEVEQPGVQPFDGSSTLLRSILAAGGHRPTGEMANVIVLRRGAGNEPVAIVRDLTADLQGRGTSDIALEPFDVVLVPKTGIASVIEFLNLYIYEVFPMLRNSSVGFMFTRQIGTETINQRTTIVP
ncbi:MAG: hypothetical protein EA406_02870 [Rhodospirillales bacterium]|nr:MAG: hypothetical protein EA406_02870 [Rhodospirillales bacterium]